MTDNCPQALLAQVELDAADDLEKGLESVGRLQLRYGSDAKLSFLRGSFLAGLKRYPQALEAMEESLRLAPDVGIFRFQLGLLQLTSGDAAAARQTLTPLERGDPDEALVSMARGLIHLMKDEFQAAIAALERGMAANTYMAALNENMKLLVDEIGQKSLQAGSETPTSPTQVLLSQFQRRQTRH